MPEGQDRLTIFSGFVVRKFKADARELATVSWPAKSICNGAVAWVHGLSMV